MIKGKKNWAFRTISNVLDKEYELTTEEQLEVAERLVNALRMLLEEEQAEANKQAEERRASFRIVS